MNKMIKNVLIAAGLMISTSAMADSYLYWMTENLSSMSGWSYAKVAYSSGSKTGYLCPVGETEGTEFLDSDAVGGDFYGMYVSIGALKLDSSYKFALELFNDSDANVGSSAWLAYSADYIGDGSFSATEAKFSGFSIPEPTSGMLSLIGFAVLALRRKRMKA